MALTSNRDGNREIYVVDLAGGNVRRLTNNPANDYLPDWSPDGSSIAFTSSRSGSYDLWTMNGDGSNQQPAVTTTAWDDYARWSPNGRRLALSTTAVTDGVPNSEIFVWSADSGLTQLTHSTAEDQWPDWSPDGRIIYCEGSKGQSNWDLLVINPDGSGRTTLVGGPQADVEGTWSPDGQWIAFSRIAADTNGNGALDEEDAGDVWVGRADGSDLRRLTSGRWTFTPAWSPDSKWLAFAQVRDSNGNGTHDKDDESDIWAVPVGGGDAVPLVQGPYQNGDPAWTW
jgi:TolB protein